MQFVEDVSSETAVFEHVKPKIIEIHCVFEGFMLKCLENVVVLDPDVSICVRGATNFQNFEDVPSETARKIANGTGRLQFIASELYSIGEVRMIVYVCVYIHIYIYTVGC